MKVGTKAQPSAGRPKPDILSLLPRVPLSVPVFRFPFRGCWPACLLIALCIPLVCGSCRHSKRSSKPQTTSIIAVRASIGCVCPYAPRSRAALSTAPAPRCLGHLGYRPPGCANKLGGDRSIERATDLKPSRLCTVYKEPCEESASGRRTTARQQKPAPPADTIGVWWCGLRDGVRMAALSPVAD